MTKDYSINTELLNMLDFYKAAFELESLPKLVVHNEKIIKYNNSALFLLEANDGFLVGGQSIYKFFTNIYNIYTDDTKKCFIKTCTNKIKLIEFNSKEVFINNKNLIFITIINDKLD